MDMKIGSKVTHRMDPHAGTGEVVEMFTRLERGFGAVGTPARALTFAKVKWPSGAVETVHESELKVKS